MDLLLLTQYFDMIKDIGVKNKTGTTLFLPHGPHSIKDLREELSHTFKSKGLSQTDKKKWNGVKGMMKWKSTSSSSDYIWIYALKFVIDLKFKQIPVTK